MTSKAPQAMPEGMNRSNRPKAPAAPPRPNKLTVEQAFEMVLDRYEDAFEARMERIDKELKALREEIRKDLERFSKVMWRIIK